MCGAVGPSALQVVILVQQNEAEISKWRQSMVVFPVREIQLRLKIATLRNALFIVNWVTGANGPLVVRLAEVVTPLENEMSKFQQSLVVLNVRAIKMTVWLATLSLALLTVNGMSGALGRIAQQLVDWVVEPEAETKKMQLMVVLNVRVKTMTVKTAKFRIAILDGMLRIHGKAVTLLAK